VTISKDEFAEIVRSGIQRRQTGTCDPANEAIGRFISDTIACLDRTG
jgi:hypothetical protein